MIKAIQVDRQDSDDVDARVVELAEDDLPAGDVTVDIDYSTLNYKDGLVLTGQGNLVRDYPHVPGIDFAGTVRASEHARYDTGDKVVLTGWHVGERHWGGYATRMRVNGDWLVPLPDGLDTRAAMAIGTAGFTAALGLLRMEAAGLATDDGPVLVTGASGGVGSIACALLAKRGYAVSAATGRDSSADYLRSLGATEIIARSDIDTPGKKPLDKERWAGCIDSVGGSTLATVLTQLRHGGAVASIGLAGGAAFQTTVIPFLLRGVSLIGIDSVTCPYEQRLEAWQLLADDLPSDHLQSMSHTVALEAVIALGADILAGKVKGRVVVDVNA